MTRNKRPESSIACARTGAGPSKLPSLFAQGKQDKLKHAPYNYTATSKLIGHRENQYAIVGLIHNHGKIRKRIDGHPKLRRPRQTKRLNRLHLRNRVHDGCGFPRKIRSQNRATLRIHRKRRRINSNASLIRPTSIRIDRRDQIGATRIDVEIETNDLGMHSIIVRDDGHGIPHGEIEHLFGKLGGSWKTRGARSKTKSRILHGKEGKGRFKALALGRVVDWNIHYRENGILLGYTVTIIREDLVDVRVSEPKAVDPALHTGVEVRITELDRAYRSLEADQAVNSLAQIFALYLTDYSELSIFVDHERVDPSKLIANHLKMPLGDIVEGDKRYSAELDLIEWTIGWTTQNNLEIRETELMASRPIHD